MADIFKTAEKGEKRLDDLYKRMDNDMKLYYLEQFVLKMMT